MDTSGKGGILRHAVGLVDPQGVHIKSFKAPTEAERRHDFLWRIEKELPEPGHDRRLRPLALRGRADRAGPRAGCRRREIERRYDAINDFEKRLVDEGTTVVKCMLHISAEEQKARLLARLEDPTKHWKFNPGDIDERQLWPATGGPTRSPSSAPTPSTRPGSSCPATASGIGKLAVAQVLLETLRRMDPTWPPPDFDIDEQAPAAEEDPLGVRALVT